MDLEVFTCRIAPESQELRSRSTLNPFVESVKLVSAE